MADDPVTLTAVREALQALLPEKIMTIAGTYEAFTAQVPPEDAKGFAAHHAACKAALGHMEALVKLARWAGDEAAPASTASGEGEESHSLVALLSEAREALEEVEM